MDSPWNVQLLGGLSARLGDQIIARFRSQKTAGLFAYLCCHPAAHTRERLIDLFWQDDDLNAGQNSLRVALSSLRKMIEPPGVPPGAVLIADRTTVRLNPVAYQTDVARFERALKTARNATDADAKARALTDAIEQYQGELLPGCLDDWVFPERERLAEAHRDALEHVSAWREEKSDWAQALDYARRSLAADPLREEAYVRLMRLSAAAGRVQDAQTHYHELGRMLRDEFGAEPSPEAHALARRLFGGKPLAPKARAKSRARSSRNRETDAASRGESLPLPSRPPAARPGSVPMQFARLVGRVQENRMLRELLTGGQTRLVTLTGPGGIGKTRLALESAATLSEDFEGGAWFVPLAGVVEPGQILAAIRETLRLPPPPGDLLEAVVAALSARPALLVLDNMEHLAAGGGPLAQTLLTRVPSLVCLTTSRRRLSLPGERELALSPLRLPEIGASVESLAQSESAQLFVEQARLAVPDYQITARNAAVIGELCRRLEGIPLAIKLMAARASVLTPAQMLTGLTERFTLLTERQAQHPDRNQSLWASLSWSYDLLPPSLRTFFTRLSVFRGGWDADAARVVCDEPQALDSLFHLRAHSLISGDDGGSRMRYQMLETLREFAAEQLMESERATLAERHAAWALALAEEAEPHLQGPDQAEWTMRLNEERDNLRAALAFSEEGDTERNLRMAVAMTGFWFARGELTEARLHLRRALAQSESTPRLARAKALQNAGVFAYQQGDPQEAEPLLEAALAARRALGDEMGAARALNALGNLFLYQTRLDEARARYEECLALARAQEDQWVTAAVLGNLGNIAYVQGDYTAAAALNRENIRLFQRLGDLKNSSYAVYNYGLTLYDQGDFAGARAAFQEALGIQQSLGDDWGAAFSLGSLGNLASREGDAAQARASLETCIGTLRDVGDLDGLGGFADGLGAALTRAGDFVAAGGRLKEALEVRGQIGDRRGMAGSLRACAGWNAAQGRWEQAARGWGAAEQARQAVGVGLPPIDRVEDERWFDRARSHLGPERFQSLWAHGAALTQDQAAAEALAALS